LFLVSTSIYARVEDAHVPTAAPNDSLLIDVGGRKIHMHAMGREHDAPAVILLPCQGCDSGVWQAVQPTLAKTMRAYAYDPAGFAWSDPSPTSLTYRMVTDDLHAALVKSGETDVVLVAFSAGGITAANYLAKYKEPRVVGIVWVEGDTFTPTGQSVFAGDGGGLPLPVLVMRPLIELGIGRLFYEQTVAPMERSLITERAPANFDWDYYDRVSATRSRIRTLHAALDTVENYPDDLRYTASLPRSISVPVFALDADWAPRFASLSGAKAQTLREQEAIRAEAWRKLAEGTPGGRYIPVANSSHNIPLEQPQVVIDAISNMVKLVAKQP
jgi:pimeloyl-ACP methyl ester carboxylesterase